MRVREQRKEGVSDSRKDNPRETRRRGEAGETDSGSSEVHRGMQIGHSSRVTLLQQGRDRDDCAERATPTLEVITSHSIR